MQDLLHNEFSELQKIKKQLSGLNDQRTRHIFSLVHGKPLVYGLPHMVYKKCGKMSCRCRRGQLHGPYPALSINKGGRQKTIMLKKSGDATVQKKARRYRHFQQTLAAIRRINREIDYLLNIIKTKTASEYLPRHREQNT